MEQTNLRKALLDGWSDFSLHAIGKIMWLTFEGEFLKATSKINEIAKLYKIYLKAPKAILMLGNHFSHQAGINEDIEGS
jgi:hypothetical protein